MDKSCCLNSRECVSFIYTESSNVVYVLNFTHCSNSVFMFWWKKKNTHFSFVCAEFETLWLKFTVYHIWSVNLELQFGVLFSGMVNFMNVFGSFNWSLCQTVKFQNSICCLRHIVLKPNHHFLITSLLWALKFTESSGWARFYPCYKINIWPEPR